LNDLSQIRFIVLDEADRMLEKQCFPQLLQILDAVDHANPGGNTDQEEDNEGARKDEDDWLGLLQFYRRCSSRWKYNAEIGPSGPPSPSADATGFGQGGPVVHCCHFFRCHRPLLCVVLN
jgi:hypothetical protein